LDIIRDATVARTQESVAAVLTDVQSALRREAKLLAKDPALVEGVARGDWAVVARGASPRLASLTLERMADLVAGLDGSRTAILQVPASPPLLLADPASLVSSSSTVTLLGGQPYVAAAAPVTGETDPAAGRSGLVLVARRLDGALSLLPGVADRPGIVFVERGKPVFSSLPLPEGGWAKAAASGSLARDRGPALLVQPARQVRVAGPGQLWRLLPDAGEARRKTLQTWLAGLAACGLASAGAALVFNRAAVPEGRTPVGASGI